MRSGWPAQGLACVLVLSVLALAGPDSAFAGDPLFQAMAITHVSGNAQAPDFALPTPDGKRRVALAELRGKVVFVNFWATWCPPCREEMPSMERLHKEFRDQGLAVLAVNMQESPKQVVRFMKDFRLTFPALLDADLKVTELYRVRGLPTTYLIDRTGRVVGQAVGARDWASPDGKALIRALLAAPAARQ